MTAAMQTLQSAQVSLKTGLKGKQQTPQLRRITGELARAT
jgi:hypothetical protein